MNSQRKISAFVLILMISFTVNAEKVYERTNSQGVAEFSDQPTPDAEVVDVNPNVVDVVQPEARAPRPASAEPVVHKQDRVRVVGEDAEEGRESYNDGSYYDDEQRRRNRRENVEHRNENIEHRQQHRGAVHRR